jgi:thiamine kinase-like enzyme
VIKPKRNQSETISLFRYNDRWIKTIKYDTETRFCPDTYQMFFDTVDFLPELYDYQWFENYLILEYEHIEGTQLPFVMLLSPEHVRIMDKAMRFLAHNVVPSFLNFSISSEKIYFHFDLKFANMIMRNGKLMLIDIDSITWMNRKYFSDVETLFYA